MALSADEADGYKAWFTLGIALLERPVGDP